MAGRTTKSTTTAKTTRAKSTTVAKTKAETTATTTNVAESAQQSARDAELELLKAQVKELTAQLNAQKTAQTQVINVVQDTEKVVLRWQAEVADDNIEVFGPNGMYGQVTGKTGKVIVPKSEWSRFYTESIRWRIDNRWLIVLSGMTEDERETYHCNYKQGELLDEAAFTKLLDMGEELVEIFPDLCIAHQEFVAQRFIQAWQDGKVTNADRQLVTELNEISKAAYAKANIAITDRRRKGAFVPLLEWMNAKDTE